MRDNYHEDYSHVSKSMLDVFMTSPLEYYLTYISLESERRHKTNDAMIVGTICHAMLLERKPLDAIAAIYPDDCYRSDGAINGARAAEFRKAHDGLHCIRAGQAEEILSIVEAVQETIVNTHIADAYSLEQRYDADLFGVACKCKPDVLVKSDDDVIHIYDLKFGEDITPFRFQQSARRFRYWLQAAHYSAVVSKCFNEPEVEFVFVAIETKYPYRVHEYRYDEEDMAAAAATHRSTLQDLRNRHAMRVWHDDWTHRIDLRPWELHEQDDLVGFADE